MAKKREEEAPKGSPAWMATFSDLMNLLLCFFVLLFSMSSVDVDKFQQVIASLQNQVTIFPQGDMTIQEGQTVSVGVNQIQILEAYYTQQAQAQNQNGDSEGGVSSIYDQYLQEALSESEKMQEEIEGELFNYGIRDTVDVDLTADYVEINLSGAILFDSGSAAIMQEAYPIIDKIGRILQRYEDNLIEVEGHTDNVPITSGKYEDNNVLSMYRALAVADYLRDSTTLDPSHLKSSGRGDYVPIADNSTAEGRALNRRVTIKVYNSYSSNFD